MVTCCKLNSPHAHSHAMTCSTVAGPWNACLSLFLSRLPERAAGSHGQWASPDRRPPSATSLGSTAPKTQMGSYCQWEYAPWWRTDRPPPPCRGNGLYCFIYAKTTVDGWCEVCDETYPLVLAKPKPRWCQRCWEVRAAEEEIDHICERHHHKAQVLAWRADGIESGKYLPLPPPKETGLPRPADLQPSMWPPPRSTMGTSSRLPLPGPPPKAFPNMSAQAGAPPQAPLRKEPPKMLASFGPPTGPPGMTPQQAGGAPTAGSNNPSTRDVLDMLERVNTRLGAMEATLETLVQRQETLERVSVRMEATLQTLVQRQEPLEQVSTRLGAMEATLETLVRRQEPLELERVSARLGAMEATLQTLVQCQEWHDSRGSGSGKGTWKGSGKDCWDGFSGWDSRGGSDSWGGGADGWDGWVGDQ
jgi:hypothetical protein